MAAAASANADEVVAEICAAEGESLIEYLTTQPYGIFASHLGRYTPKARGIDDDGRMPGALLYAALTRSECAEHRAEYVEVILRAPAYVTDEHARLEFRRVLAEWRTERTKAIATLRNDEAVLVALGNYYAACCTRTEIIKIEEDVAAVIVAADRAGYPLDCGYIHPCD